MVPVPPSRAVSAEVEWGWELKKAILGNNLLGLAVDPTMRFVLYLNPLCLWEVPMVMFFVARGAGFWG